MGKKKGGRRPSADGGLSITSMMDMMTIILVFLLKSYSTSDITVAPSDDLEIPTSSAEKIPQVNVNVVVSRKDITVDGDRVVDLSTDAEGKVNVPDAELQGQLVKALHSTLLDRAENAKAEAERLEDTEFEGEILLQVDRRIPFSLVRQVMFTAGQAQFGKFRFVVIKNSG